MSITPYIPPSYLTSLPTGLWTGVGGRPVFPYLPGQAVTMTKTALWATKVKRAASGRERRTAQWPFPLWRFEISYELIRHRPTNDELAMLYEFFNVAQGQFAPWLFVDPTDNAVTAEPFGIGDGSTTAFQLTRNVNSASEPVYAVYSPTVQNNGSPTTAYALGTDGVIIFSTAPAAGHVLTWTGYFYYLCRFDQDDLSFAQIVDLLWDGKGLKFTSLRP